MKDKDFKKSLKVSDSKLSVHQLQIDDLSTEALYLYTNNSLNEIFYFLSNFYKENQEENMLESGYNEPSHAESYYYSLRYELSDAYRNYLDGKLNIEDFERQFNKVCSHYKTNPLTIYTTHDLVVQAKEKKGQNDLKNIVDSIEAETDACWKKINEDRESQK